MNDWFFNMHKIIINIKRRKQSVYYRNEECIDAMKLAGSKNIAKTYEAHLKKLIDKNS